MNIEIAKFAFDVVQTLMIAVIGIMNWLNNRQRVTSAAVSKLETGIDERLDDHTERLTRLEQDIKNAPSHNDLAEIYREMRKMADTLANMNSSINSQLAGQKEAISGLKENLVFWRTEKK